MSAPPNLFLVRPEDLAAAWPKVSPWLASMANTSKGKFSLESIAVAIATGQWQLWAYAPAGAVKACYVGRILEFPHKRVYEPIALAGADMLADRAEWLAILAFIEDWARAEGCQAMQVLGAPGFERFAASCGYAKTHVMLEKEL